MAASPDNPLSANVVVRPGRLAEVMVGLAAGLGMFLAALDIALNVALPSIRSDFASDYQTVQWIIVVFIATRAGLVLTAGSLADRLGLRRVYLFGGVTYLASMVCIACRPTWACWWGSGCFKPWAPGACTPSRRPSPPACSPSRGGGWAWA